jgi:hypothetical protein
VTGPQPSGMKRVGHWRQESPGQRLSEARVTRPAFIGGKSHQTSVSRWLTLVVVPVYKYSDSSQGYVPVPNCQEMINHAPKATSLTVPALPSQDWDQPARKLRDLWGERDESCRFDEAQISQTLGIAPALDPQAQKLSRPCSCPSSSSWTPKPRPSPMPPFRPFPSPSA